MKWSGQRRNRQLNQDEPHLTHLLKNEEEKYIYNNVAYQSKDSRVNTCGSHMVHRLYKLKNDNKILPNYYVQTNVGYAVIVA